MPSLYLSKWITLFLIVTLITGCSDQKDKKKPDQGSADELAGGILAPTSFEVDPFWPKPLPNHWVLGEVAGIATDADDHIWIIQRPASLHERETGAMKNPPEAECCAAAPSVLEFDTEGNFLQAWGNPDTTKRWLTMEHGIYVDQKGFVWVGGAFGDHVVMKLTKAGELLLTIGQFGKTNGSNDKVLLGAPADFTVDTTANELFIADGYVNRRVIVFDAESGEYKRHWGAYGSVPHDDTLAPYNPNDSLSKTFRSPVHAVRISNDNQLYVADRANNRLQIFNKDGSFIKEKILAEQTLGMGGVWDIEFSQDLEQSILYIADGMNMKIWILQRSTLEVIGTIGQGGRNAGQFGWIHNVAMDSKGNLYTSEVNPGKRIQKFKAVTDH